MKANSERIVSALRVLSAIFKVLIAYFASIAASTFYSVATASPPIIGLSLSAAQFMALSKTLQFFAFCELILSFVPWLICVALSFAFSIRHPLWYFAWSLVPLVFLVPQWGLSTIEAAPAALIAGAIYWALAGRFAGRNKSAARQ
jgi:hypothetical protein